MQHHAYGIYGEFAETISFATNFIERTHNISFSGNPDFEVIKYDSFSVADARVLSSRATLLPLVGDTKVYIIAIKRISTEAQNTLLKLLEEPPSGTIIVIAIAYATMLLPTVLSRLMPISFHEMSKIKMNTKSEDAETLKVIKEVHMFLQDNQTERIAYIKKAFNSNTIKPHVLRSNGALFLDIMEKSIYKVYENANDTTSRNTLREGLRDIETLRQYLYEKVTQAKMLFEHLAIVLPIIDA